MFILTCFCQEKACDSPKIRGYNLLIVQKYSSCTCVSCNVFLVDLETVRPAFLKEGRPQKGGAQRWDGSSV